MNNDKIVLDLEEQLLNDDGGVLFDNLMTRLGEIKPVSTRKAKKCKAKKPSRKLKLRSSQYKLP